MIIPGQKFEKKVNRKNIDHFILLGYDVKLKDMIIIPPEYLSRGSNIKIKVKCDECGKEKLLRYCEYLINTKNQTVNYTCSEKCSRNKAKSTCSIKYGDPNFVNPEKTKQTKLKNHGDENFNNRKQAKETWKNKSNEEIAKIISKRKDTNKKKFGVEFASQRKGYKEIVSEVWKNKSNEEMENINKKRIETCNNKSEKEKQEIVDKRKETMLEKYNIPHNWSGKYGTRKCEETKKELYGNPNYNNPEKMQQTKLKNHGDSGFNNRKKAEDTCLEKYGVKHNMQNIEFYKKAIKSLFKLKDYVLSSDKVIKVQGYEPLALDILFRKGYKENDLLIEDNDIEQKIGKIFYYDKKGKKRRYFPDIYIISENKIIEVKSIYTFNLHKEINLLKQERCIEMGINFKFMIFNGKKQLLSESQVKDLIK